VSEERRVVTILFCDVVGSTALGESLDPEDVRAMMSRYFGIARDVVSSHGGTLEKFIGDAVMAVFGLPSAHGDDPARALAAALELRDAIRVDPVLSERTPIRIGVNTGDVVATRETSGGEFLITGDAVNTTARLEQAAEPWEILAGQRTTGSAGGTFAFGPVRGVEAKGKSQPIPARALVGRTAAPAPRRLPLVGRDDDLTQLDLVARRAFGERRPYLVSVIAPAGTGKSRLLEEFLDRLPAMADAEVAITQCVPYGQRLTYAPLRALLVRLLGLVGDPSADDLRTAARDWLRAAGDPEADRTADLLGATLGSGDVEGVDRAELFAAWRSVVERAAARRPLVLVIEDLHWSSDSLLDLIDAILQPRGAAPILMLVLARPELLDRRPTWGGGRRNYVSLALEPLADGSVAELVDDLLGQRAPGVAARVVERAEGNPFYAGEIVRAVLERAPDLEPAAVEAALASLPDSVQATVLARIDLLEPAARRSLQVGSVFGRSFPLLGLAAVDPTLTGSAGGVDQLVDRDLVRPPLDADYTFRHILIREVAYGTLPRVERSRLHAAAARFLADHANGRSDELAELIAFHFREAATVGGLLGPVPAEVREAAVRWLRRAADVAMAGAANFEAARHLRAAIDLAEPEDAPELNERLGEVFIAGEEAIDAYETALVAARARGRSPDQELGLIAAQLVVWTRWHGSVGTDNLDRLERLIAEGNAILPATTDRRKQARFQVAQAFMSALHHGATTDAEVAAATSAANAGLALARSIDDVNLMSEAYDALGSVAMDADDYARSVELCRTRLEYDDRLSMAERMDARVVLAWSLEILGRITESLAVVDETLARLGPNQGLSFQLSAGAWRVTNLQVLGRWDEAIAAARRLDEVWIETDRPAAGYATHGWLAALEIGRARRDEAVIEAARVVADDITGRFAEGSRSRRSKSLIHLDLDAIEREMIGNWPEYASRMDQIDRAIRTCVDRGHVIDPTVLRAMLPYMEAHGIRPNVAQIHRALGVQEGDETLLRESLAAFTAMGAVPSVARVQTELGALTGDAAMFEAGVATLERLGDVDQLARVAARRAS
jgi:class 3 adenylate cyclase/tetratricopeptide (TPR) repeat protein